MGIDRGLVLVMNRGSSHRRTMIESPSFENLMEGSFDVCAPRSTVRAPLARVEGGRAYMHS